MRLNYFETNENGNVYIVNGETKELMEVTIVSYKACFGMNADGSKCAETYVTYKGHGIEETTTLVSNVNFYSSIKGFKEGDVVSLSDKDLSHWAINSHININGGVDRRDETKGVTYIFNGVEGVMKEFDIKSINYRIRANSYIEVVDIALDTDFTGIETYYTLADVYKFNDIMVIKEDGTKELHEGIAKKLMLTDEQKALFEEFKSIVKKITETSDMRIVLDEDESTFIAFNTKHIDEYNYGECASDDDQISARSLTSKQGVDMKGKFTYFSESLALTIK